MIEVLTDAILILICRDREGEDIDRGLLKTLLNMYVEIGQYKEGFEASMLEATSSYYSEKASRWIVEHSCSDYLRKVEEVLREELDRVFHYLHYSTERALFKILYHELLIVHETTLLEKAPDGFLSFLKDGRTEDMSRLGRLFARIPSGLVAVSDIFKKHLTSEGMTLVKEAKDARSNPRKAMSILSKLMKLHDRYLAYRSGCFMDRLVFRGAHTEAFKIICKEGIFELFVTVCHDILKKDGCEKWSDELFESMIEKNVKMELLDYISDKDPFFKNLGIRLAQRLVNYDKSTSIEHESRFLRKLTEKFGCLYTSRMELMLTEFKVSAEIQSLYESRSNADPGIDFSVTVLNSRSLPEFRTFDGANLPEEMERHAKDFSEFYGTVTENRELEIMHTFGTCTIDGCFDDNNVELIVTPCQASVLLLFNSFKRLRYQDIVKELNLPHEVVVSVLESLSLGKYEILIKEPDNKVICENDYFEFNPRFKDDKKSIKIPPPLQRPTEEIVPKIDMKYKLQAAIVGIMEKEEVLEYNTLVSKCVECMDKYYSFKVEEKVLIKKMIEYLVSLGTLERDSTEPQHFRFVKC